MTEEKKLTDDEALLALRPLLDIKPEDYDGTEFGRIYSLVHQLMDRNRNDPTVITGHNLLVGRNSVNNGDNPRIERKGTCVGGRFPCLIGKTAIVYEILDQYADPGIVPNGSSKVDHLIAQFDDVTTGYGFGWHAFNTEDFTLEPVEQDAKV